MKLNTHTFIMPSGVEAEVTELLGKHQRMLTQQLKGESHLDRLNKVLADVLVRVGSKKGITLETVEGMLTEDRRACLVAARQYTMDFEPIFHYTFQWEGANGQETIEIPVRVGEDGSFPVKPMAKQYAEDSEIERVVEIVLPKSQLKVKYHLLDGKGEKVLAHSKKSERSSHTLLQARRIQYFNEEAGTWVSLNLDKVGLKDLDFIRQSVKDSEGKIDTEIRFEHPAYEELGLQDKYVVVDLLSSINFFFPLGMI